MPLTEQDINKSKVAKDSAFSNPGAAEQKRLISAREQAVPWKKWGPYLSERQWGTVREDYSEGGDAWNYFTHDQARSRAYRWGEDGIAGLCDENQILCFALALWNGADPILKERMFGLTNSEGNHGEDVKEYYFYLDSTPTHSYMKYLYKYPQGAFPYGDLIETNKRRNRGDMEYELLDTAIFNGDRYFDVFVEYAKESAEDILIRITVANRGPQRPVLIVLPTLWFRNTWSWGKRFFQTTLGAESRVRGHVGDCRFPSRPWRPLSLLRRFCAFALHGERDESGARVRQAQPHSVREGWNQRIRRAWPRRQGESEEDGDQSRARITSWRCRPEKVGSSGCG